MPDARVAGFLVEADIGRICFGNLYGADRDPGNLFVRFESVGLDNRNGYDQVQTADGHAYVIVRYADHSKERGVSQLREHIHANKEFYDARFNKTWIGRP